MRTDPIESASTNITPVALWIRTGRWVPAQVADPALEVKFNPNHDPTSGQFTFAYAGTAGAHGDRVVGSYSGSLRRPSKEMMGEATNTALRSVPGGGHAAPLTSEFAKVARLPNFKGGGWRAVDSSHSSSAFEHDLGNTGKAVKVYISDRNFGGANTVTITDQTESIGHYAAFPDFEIGMPVNARNAAVYLYQLGR